MHNKCIIHTTVKKLFLFSLRHQENVSALEFGQKVCEHTHFIVLMSTKVSMMVMWILIKNKESPYICKTSDKRFAYESNLKRHQATCNGTKLYFECNKCGKKKLAKRLLRQHDMVHQSKRFQCQKCGRQFRYNKNCKQHAAKCNKA